MTVLSELTWNKGQEVKTESSPYKVHHLPTDSLMVRVQSLCWLKLVTGILISNNSLRGLLQNQNVLTSYSGS